MSASSRFYLVFGLFALQVGSPGRSLAADEATRTFPALKCRYTLPGPDWSWLEAGSPSIHFMARNKTGFVVNMTTYSAIMLDKVKVKFVTVDQQFGEVFEQSHFAESPQLEKRGGRLLTFRSVPSYQVECKVPDGRTVVTRAFIAHGIIYEMNIVGGQEPVEKDPAFETIVHGFDFTAPPEPAPPRAGPNAGEVPGAGGTAPARSDSPGTNPDYEEALNISAWMGRIAGGCLLAALLVAIITWSIRRGKPSNATVRRPRRPRTPRPEDDEDTSSD